MILAWLMIILLFGGLAAWFAGRSSEALARWIALLATAAGLALTLGIWSHHASAFHAAPSGRWLIELSHPWIPRFGISLHLGLDGLSLLLVVLTMILGVISVLVSWDEIHHRVGFYYFNLLAVLTGILGVFLSLDLFLFYFFWELMLVPMALLIAIWGYERRHYAAIKFFLFTQFSGLLMLIAIVALVLIHASNTGVTTFDYPALLGTKLSDTAGMWLMLGFFIAFAVKLPVVLVHSWLPDAHTEAPTAGSVILAGLLLKTGAYGLLRFVLPLFPAAAAAFAPVAMLLAVIGILYGALLAFGQTDLKRLVAYTSVSHMGFVLLGIFSFNLLALQGAVLEMVAHAFSTGALFIIVGALQHRIHTRDLNRMGGFWAVAPRLAGCALFFALASLGLPGLGNFVAEFLVLLGAFQADAVLTSWAAAGLVLAVVYSLWIVQRAFHGPAHEGARFPDFALREMAVMTAMILMLLWLGLYPQPVLDAAGHSNLQFQISDFKFQIPIPQSAIENGGRDVRAPSTIQSQISDFKSQIPIPQSAIRNPQSKMADETSALPVEARP